MLRRQFTRLVGAGAVASALPALITPARAADPLKVGFIYLGPVGDFGWTYQHDIARKAAVEHFGDKIKTTYVENVAEGPDSEKVLNDLANQGHKLIFATSFGYMNYVLNSAKRHPAVFYEHATGYKRAANVSTYNIRFYQARYVQGVIAGKLSKAGLAGYVGSVPVPGSRAGHQRLHARHAVGQSEGAAEVRADQLLVRSAEGRRRGQGADRPGLRHHHPAHRLAGTAAGRRQPWRKGVRPVHRHGEVRHRHAAERQHRRLGAILHQADRRRAGRHLEKHRHLGRVRQRHAGDVAVHQHAGRRRGAGDRDGRRTSNPARTRCSSGRSRIRAARSRSRPAPRWTTPRCPACSGWSRAWTAN